jgi:hypothetical protein
VDYNSLEFGNPKEYFDIFTVENLTKLFPKVPGTLGLVFCSQSIWQILWKTSPISEKVKNYWIDKTACDRDQSISLIVSVFL